MTEVYDAIGRGDIWGALERTLGAALAGFYALIPVYGISIMLLTVAVRLLVWPLVSKQTRSMVAMQKVQPEVKRIQAKYKGDRQKLNEELMKFYQENRINPLAGCLPLVVQMPVMFALFRVFAPPPGSSSVLDVASRAATGAPAACPPGVLPRGVHGLIPSTSALRRSLDCTTQSFLGMDLAKRPSDFISQFPDAIPYVLLVAAVIVTGYIQSRQMQKRTPASAQNPQMAMLSKIMPVFLGFITYTLSAGLGVYFAVGNLWQIGQQEMIFRQQQSDARREKERAVEEKAVARAKVRAGVRSGDGDGEATARPARPASSAAVPSQSSGPRQAASARSNVPRASVGSRPADRNKKKRRKKGR